VGPAAPPLGWSRWHCVSVRGSLLPAQNPCGEALVLQKRQADPVGSDSTIILQQTDSQAPSACHALRYSLNQDGRLACRTKTLGTSSGRVTCNAQCTALPLSLVTPSAGGIGQRSARCRAKRYCLCARDSVRRGRSPMPFAVTTRRCAGSDARFPSRSYINLVPTARAGLGVRPS
jgi:hypothetical protein